MNIFERIITEDQGIMREYEKIIDPIMTHIKWVEKDMKEHPSSYHCIERNEMHSVFQYVIPQEYIPKSSWFDKLTIITNIIINHLHSFDPINYNEAMYVSTKSTYNEQTGKIIGGLIYVSYEAALEDYVCKALGHEFMHLYEDYNRLKNKSKSSDGTNNIPSMLQLSNGAYENILKLTENTNDFIKNLGLLLYTLTDSEQNAIVQEIFTVVKNNRDIDKDNYKEILCKECEKYKTIVAIRDIFLPYLKTLEGKDWGKIMVILKGIFKPSKDSLVFKKSFINFAEQSLILLIKKVNRAIHYGIEEHHCFRYSIGDQPLSTSFMSKEDIWDESINDNK